MSPMIIYRKDKKRKSVATHIAISTASILSINPRIVILRIIIKNGLCRLDASSAEQEPIVIKIIKKAKSDRYSIQRKAFFPSWGVFSTYLKKYLLTF